MVVVNFPAQMKDSFVCDGLLQEANQGQTPPESG